MIDHKTVSVLASSSHIPSTFPYHLSKKTLISLQCSSVSHLFSRFFSKCSNPTFSPRFSRNFPTLPPLSTDQRPRGQGPTGAAAQRGPEKDAAGPSVGEQGGEGGKFGAAGDGRDKKHHEISWLSLWFMKSYISTVLCGY